MQEDNKGSAKAKAASSWNALNVVTASGGLTRFSIHDSSDCKNHITVVLQELAQIKIKDQKGCPVPILVSPLNQTGLESLARELQLNPEEAGTGWNSFQSCHTHPKTV